MGIENLSDSGGEERREIPEEIDYQKPPDRAEEDELLRRWRPSRELIEAIQNPSDVGEESELEGERFAPQETLHSEGEEGIGGELERAREELQTEVTAAGKEVGDVETYIGGVGSEVEEFGVDISEEKARVVELGEELDQLSQPDEEKEEGERMPRGWLWGVSEETIRAIQGIKEADEERQENSGPMTLKAPRDVKVTTREVEVPKNVTKGVEVGDVSTATEIVTETDLGPDVQTFFEQDSVLEADLLKLGESPTAISALHELAAKDPEIDPAAHQARHLLYLIEGGGGLETIKAKNPGVGNIPIRAPALM